MKRLPAASAQARRESIDSRGSSRRILNPWVLGLLLFATAGAEPASGAAEALPTGAKSIAAGEAHACAVTYGGALWCWGSNWGGQLGDGTRKDRPAGVRVSGLPNNVVAVAAGEDHTCALTSAGGVKCWGMNWAGQLGDGTSSSRSVPGDVAGLESGVVDIAAGDAFTCALRAGGSLYCWGSNLYGAMGGGTDEGYQLTPVVVSSLGAGVATVAAGGNHVCGATAGGAAFCWGSNYSAEIGDGTIGGVRSTPTPVVGLASGVSSIAAGGGTTCAVVDGAARCWGANGLGTAGDGTDELYRKAPVAVAGLGLGVAAISVGGGHACAIDTAGGLWCWGSNSNGQLGIGTRSASGRRPVAVPELAGGVGAVGAGGEFSCARVGSIVKCWGSNDDGQLGVGTDHPSVLSAPRAVVGSDSYARIDGGAGTSCAVTTGGAARCWGRNSGGQLGDGTVEDRATPVTVAGLASGVSAVTAGSTHTCALTAAAGVKCWGSIELWFMIGLQSLEVTILDSRTPVDVPGLAGGVSAVAAGGAFTCAVQSGAARCWGANFAGNLGDGTYTYRNEPGSVTGLASGVAAVDAGLSHACALTSEGAVWCWGSNGKGQLGNGTTSTRSTPVAVTGLDRGVAAIALGSRHSCALLAGGGVKCWGENTRRQLGDGTSTQSTTPVEVVGLGGPAVAIAAGGEHVCALMEAGGVKCWGSNEYGQLGNAGKYTTTVVDVEGLGSGIAAIGAGEFHTCAVSTEGAARCWGINDYGEIGIGELGYSAAPVTALATANHQGLWWNPGESGWGINFSHQGDTVFATWFTYDDAGKPWWLIALLERTANGSFAGPVSTVVGPPFEEVPFDIGKVVETIVGNATLTFASGASATFAYTIAGTARSKAIVPQEFPRRPVCAWAAQPDLALATNFTDLWWNANESGWGINLSHQGDIVFATWFTYDSAGKPWWLIALLERSGAGVYAGPVSTVAGPPWDSEPFDTTKVVETIVGSATLTFTDGNSASFAYTVGAVTRTKAIVRQVYVFPGTACR